MKLDYPHCLDCTSMQTQQPQSPLSYATIAEEGANQNQNTPDYLYSIRL